MVGCMQIQLAMASIILTHSMIFEDRRGMQTTVHHTNDTFSELMMVLQ